MTSEFKKIKNNEDTHYVLETATAGATSAGVVATAPGKKREDSILAQETNKKKETAKPRNFVAKNAKMGGAGQHKDKKKAAKQGAVKHKKPLAESYAEDLAKQVFDANPNIKDENAVLDAAWPIVVQDLGKKTAMSMFNYDEDFPSDLVSVYGWLQKGTSESVSDLSYDAQSLITKLRRDVEEKRLRPTPEAVLAAARELAGDMEFAPQLLVKQVLGQGVAEGFNGEYDDEAGMAHTNLLTSARAVMGLLKTIEDKDNLPEWVQEKIAKAEMMLVGVWDYLQSQKEQGIDPQVEGFGKMRGSSSAYDRDYASSVSGMGRGPDHRGLGQELAHETNNYAVAIDGKTWKVFADQRQAENIARSLKAKGKNATVHPTGENPSESADPYFESLKARVEELAKK